jgi:hypothetical protein
MLISTTVQWRIGGSVADDLGGGHNRCSERSSIDSLSLSLRRPRLVANTTALARSAAIYRDHWRSYYENAGQYIALTLTPKRPDCHQERVSKNLEKNQFFGEGKSSEMSYKISPAWRWETPHSSAFYYER